MRWAQKIKTVLVLLNMYDVAAALTFKQDQNNNVYLFIVRELIHTLGSLFCFFVVRLPFVFWTMSEILKVYLLLFIALV